MVVWVSLPIRPLPARESSGLKNSANNSAKTKKLQIMPSSVIRWISDRIIQERDCVTESWTGWCPQEASSCFWHIRLCTGRKANWLYVCAERKREVRCLCKTFNCHHFLSSFCWWESGKVCSGPSSYWGRPLIYSQIRYLPYCSPSITPSGQPQSPVPQEPLARGARGEPLMQPQTWPATAGCNRPKLKWMRYIHVPNNNMTWLANWNHYNIGICSVSTHNLSDEVMQ